MSETNGTPILEWDFGTAYEFFISLQVLHMPEHFGIRAAWAAGIRSRIPVTERKFLEGLLPFLGFPLGWVHNLPGEKDAISVLWALKQIPPAMRLIRILGLDCMENDWGKMLLKIQQEGKWSPADLEMVKAMAKKERETKLTEAKIVNFLDQWAKPEELGEGFLSALQAFYHAFFEDEEKRLAPVLEAALKNAQELASKHSVESLVSELSQGVHLSEIMSAKTLTVVPAYWTTPLVLYEKISEEGMLFCFGARPADMAAIPGEMVPDSLVRVMKALADPTRLKILYYLSQEELTPSELARRLHLRAPTVTHHLSELRLSSLVNLNIKGQERWYRAREESLEAMCVNLKEFLHTKKN
jgi:DNA-binding transcriptional ArsR family regulator